MDIGYYNFRFGNEHSQNTLFVLPNAEKQIRRLERDSLK